MFKTAKLKCRKVNLINVETQYAACSYYVQTTRTALMILRWTVNWIKYLQKKGLFRRPHRIFTIHHAELCVSLLKFQQWPSFSVIQPLNGLVKELMKSISSDTTTTTTTFGLQRCRCCFVIPTLCSVVATVKCGWQTIGWIIALI